MTKRLHPLLFFFILLFCLGLMAGSTVFLLYITDIFPNFTRRVEPFIPSFIKKNKGQTLPKAPILPIKIPEISVSPFFPIFIEEQDREIPVQISDSFSEYDMNFLIINSAYTLQCSAMFERLDEHYEGTEYPLSSWTYNGEWPIISKPCLFSDALVFIDAEPKLIMLDLKTGTVLKTLPSPIYPAGPAVIKNEFYFFLGRNDLSYAVEFLRETPQKDLSLADGSVKAVEFSEVFSLSDEFQSIVCDKLKTWMNIQEDIILPRPQLLPDSQRPLSILLQEKKPLIFVYTPEKQGNCTVGLCDERGSWISKKAFTAVFSSDGELLSVSIDYVADKPQVNLHLSDSQFYYILIAAFFDAKTDNAYLLIKKGS